MLKGTNKPCCLFMLVTSNVVEDGDVEMTVPQPVYEFICAPPLAKSEQGALIPWYRDWNHYQDKITNAVL
ncbi:uncharacterized protein PITG_11320 [Phytophthora infestans T30-4]|uniref:Uncharacterized protein n=1 Tax=Phytophthora infestans (strain T30-4) TaxID=403677 RepID=D0NIJ1_PHYIT|nr:uncharacterized protein PITG_11320 [Phytophthora infestans T30-4]EEY59325.1 hypothetical protein PITG_11320 [Phytophthora infestans T30-4]|eukprot:XP_002900935.1 hypothetical protein PITG_11320 [Phytophthora infestans T30-4]